MVMQREKLSRYLITIGSILNVTGAALNSFHVRMAFLIWILSSLLFAIFFFAAWRGMLKMEKTGDLAMFGTYLFYLGTSVIGWIN